jgi:hypothetical protein
MARSTALILLAAALLCLNGCASKFESKPDGSNSQDEDNDGYTKDVDCDDKDAQVYPGAAERANCKDDNCNGEIDEGTSNYDSDHDGYCPSTGDIVTATGDCEGNAKRHPGMPEDGGTGTGLPNGIDDNCNGLVDEGLATSDVDKDGFSVKDGDCNDSDPNINPGAIEVEGMRCKTTDDCPTGRCYDGYCRCVGDEDCSSAKSCASDKECTFPGETCKSGLCKSGFLCKDAQEGIPNPALRLCRDGADNDCDGRVDEVDPPCDDPAALNQDDPYDYARAMEICDTSKTCGIDAACPGKLKCVNGHCSRVLSATFNSDADKRARAIAVEFAQGGPFKPKAGQSFVVMSTGVASYVPKDICPQSGTEFSNTHVDPDPTTSDKEANDYVELALEILVPSNAQSFEFDFHFFSTEYPEWVGSEFNDTFWVQLNSKKFTGNVSFDSKNVPIRINNAFFNICDGPPPMCQFGSDQLTGTGYAKDCTELGGNPNEANGGSTGWLHTKSPVTPGETIKLIFSIFDKGDHVLDSAVLIDNFQWNLMPAAKPTTGPG